MRMLLLEFMNLCRKISSLGLKTMMNWKSFAFSIGKISNYSEEGKNTIRISLHGFENCANAIQTVRGEAAWNR